MPIPLDPFQGLKIEVISGGRSLELYDDPDVVESGAPTYPYKRSHYIESIPDATFVVRVTVTQDFELHGLKGEDAVKARIKYDGAGSWLLYWVSERNITAYRTHGIDTSVTMARAVQYCPLSQKWNSGFTVFSTLNIDEAVNGTKLFPRKVKDLGSFQIEIQRVKRALRPYPVPLFYSIDEPVTTVSEKLIKGKAISNVTRLQSALTTTAPDSTHIDTPLYGEAGKQLEIIIRYRSKQSLQAMGCIPRTPSPEPDLRELTLRLQEQVADLQRDLAARRIKREDSRSATPVKREREATGDENERKRLRGAQAEIIDLTED